MYELCRSYVGLVLFFVFCFLCFFFLFLCFFFQAEDGIRDLVRSRGLGDVYKRQELASNCWQMMLVVDY